MTNGQGLRRLEQLRAAKAENAELKEVLKAQVVAACNERITALEERLKNIEAVIKERGIGWEDWSNAADALSGYWKVEDAEKAVLEDRLEQCEAAMKEARFLLNTTTKQHLTMQLCPCKVCQADRALRVVEADAARAVMEGK